MAWSLARDRERGKEGRREGGREGKSEGRREAARGSHVYEPTTSSEHKPLKVGGEDVFGSQHTTTAATLVKINTYNMH